MSGLQVNQKSLINEASGDDMGPDKPPLQHPPWGSLDTDIFLTASSPGQLHPCSLFLPFQRFGSNWIENAAKIRVVFSFRLMWALQCADP
ncbi:hypothetical protein ACOMHN_031566 [Nucella lapillus]